MAPVDWYANLYARDFLSVLTIAKSECRHRRMLAAIQIDGIGLPEQRCPLEHLFFPAILAEPFGVFDVFARILRSVILRGAAASITGGASSRQAPSVVDATDVCRLRPQHWLYCVRIVVVVKSEGCVGHDLQ